MEPSVLPLRDEARGRPLPTTLYGTEGPLVVWAHGMWGHPRKFTHLLGRWAQAGYVVAAPAFPRTNDENPPPYEIEDVVNQPADVSFVIDALLARGIGDPRRIGVGGFSLGAETALAVGLHPGHGDPRVRAVVAAAGCLFHPGLAAAQLLPRPVLLAHGDADKTVRIAESLAVYEKAHEPKELVTFAGAGHDICEDTGMPYAAEFAERTLAFWREYL